MFDKAVVTITSCREGYIVPSTIIPFNNYDNIHDPASNVNFRDASMGTYHASELLIFIVIGIVGGCLGCLLLTVFSFYRRIVTKGSIFKNYPLLLTAISASITLSVLFVTGLYFRSPTFSYLGLFQYDSLKLDFLMEPGTGAEKKMSEYLILAVTQAIITIVGANTPVCK